MRPARARAAPGGRRARAPPAEHRLRREAPARLAQHRPRPASRLRLDIRRPLPFPEGSCAEIYSEHVLEHLAYPGEVEEVLRDWWRVLAPGGTLSVGVPDTVYPLASYVNQVDDYFAWCRTQPWNPPWIATRLDQINFHFRQQGLGFGQDHLYAYDVGTLAVRLTSTGFVDIAQRPYDPARDSRAYTLYVDATKPRG